MLFGSCTRSDVGVFAPGIDKCRLQNKKYCMAGEGEACRRMNGGFSFNRAVTQKVGATRRNCVTPRRECDVSFSPEVDPVPSRGSQMSPCLKQASLPLSQVHILLRHDYHHFPHQLISALGLRYNCSDRRWLGCGEHISLKTLYHPTAGSQRREEGKRQRGEMETLMDRLQDGRRN